jgi:hypothetical protein
MGLMRRLGLVGSPMSAWVCRYGLGFADLGLGLGLLDDLGLGLGLLNDLGLGVGLC